MPDGNGIADFLADNVHLAGAYAHDAVKWCREVGATETAAYLSESIGTLPNGYVSPDSMERIAAVEAARSRDRRVWETLDGKYPEAYVELAAALRSYVRSQRHEMLAALEIARQRADARPIAEGALSPALATSDPEEFFDAVLSVGRRLQRRWPPLEELPELLRMTIVLRALWFNLKHEGSWKFLDEDLAEYFHQAIEWASLIDAPETAAYLKAIAKLFARGRVPKNYRRRAEAVENLDTSLRELDARYREAVIEELPRRVRVYIAAHQAETEKSFANGAGP